MLEQAPGEELLDLAQTLLPVSRPVNARGQCEYDGKTKRLAEAQSLEAVEDGVEDGKEDARTGDKAKALSVRSQADFEEF